MGSGQEIVQLPLKTDGQHFDEQFPHYLAIGMSYDEFWNQDSDLVHAYRLAHQIQLREKNQLLWMQGRYFYDALSAVSPVLNAFAKAGTQAEKYAEWPYPITLAERVAEEERVAKAKREVLRASLVAYSDAWERTKSKGGEKP